MSLAIGMLFLSMAFLVKDRAPQAVIVRDLNAGEAERYAAEELQRWVGEITDTFVPVRPSNGDLSAPVKVFVGWELAKQEFRKDYGKFRGLDGYAVRNIVTNGETRIYVFGCQPRGTLNGVYALIERNSDIIWLRPDPKVGTVYGKAKDFVVREADFIDVPKTVGRSWKWTWSQPNANELEWQARNRVNLGSSEPRFDSHFVTGGQGHGIQKWIDRKVYFEKHPEWYPADRQGKRHAGTGQVCFLAYDMIPTYVSNIVSSLDAEYRNQNRGRVKVDFFNVSCDDNWDVCHCAKCERPFVCENGVVVDPTNEVFRSAQHYTFLNKVARELAKTYPRVTLGTYAYQFTLLPPPFPLEKSVIIEYCPYGLNEKAPVTDEASNSFWLRCWRDWGRFSPNTTCRYYLGWANEFPRQVEGALQANGIFNQTLKYPIKYFSAEQPPDRICAGPNSIETWDSSAISTWVYLRLWWDPEQDLDRLRETFCRRAFREGWESMKAFYDTIRDSVYSDDLPSLYTSGDPVPYAVQYIVRPGLTDKLRGCLDAAAKAARHPVSRELIARQRKHFERWIQAAKSYRELAMRVPYRADAKLADSFDAPFWDELAGTGDLVVADPGERHGQQARYRTTAKIVHDRENLFIRFDCWAPDMATLKANAPATDSIEKVPRGDVVEFYLGSGAAYYQFILDVGNGGERSGDATYDAKVFDNSWTGNWTRRSKRYADKWVTIVKMPLADIGVTAVASGRVTFQAIRGKMYDGGRKDYHGNPVMDREMASWGGGWVHQSQTFGELKLELK